jgi:periplasmic mercuric ion binding protein
MMTTMFSGAFSAARIRAAFAPHALSVALATVACCALMAQPVLAADKTESVKVWGNCGMCKKTIEKSLKGVDGVKSASWDKKTKMLAVSYDDSKISMKAIEDKVAASGYDTQNNKGSDAAYTKLHECCKYDRKK